MISLGGGENGREEVWYSWSRKSEGETHKNKPEGELKGKERNRWSQTD